MKYLTLDEVKNVLLAVDDERERLGIKVAFWHGLRASEVCAMNGASIRDGKVRIVRLKGSLKTQQSFVQHSDPVLDEAAELTKLAAEVGPREKLFPFRNRFRFNYMFGKAAAKAGIDADRQHPHVLKHSIAHLTIASGIEVTRQWCGHKSIASTGAYLKIDDDAAHKGLMAALAGGK